MNECNPGTGAGGGHRLIGSLSARRLPEDSSKLCFARLGKLWTHQHKIRVGTADDDDANRTGCCWGHLLITS